MSLANLRSFFGLVVAVLGCLFPLERAGRVRGFVFQIPVPGDPASFPYWSNGFGSVCCRSLCSTVISWCLKCGTLRFEICIYRRFRAFARLASLAARLSLSVIRSSGGCSTILRNCGRLGASFSSSGRAVSIVFICSFIFSRLMILRRLPKLESILTAMLVGRGAWLWRSAWLLLDTF